MSTLRIVFCKRLLCCDDADRKTLLSLEFPLVYVGNLLVIPTVPQNRFFHAHLEGEEDIVNGVCFDLTEALVNSGDQFINVDGMFFVLTGLNGREQSKVEDVRVGAVRRLIDESDIDPCCRDSIDPILVVSRGMRPRVILMDLQRAVMHACRELLNDGWENRLDYHLSDDFLIDHNRLRLHCARRSVPSCSDRFLSQCKRPEPYLSIPLSIVAWPRESAQEHDLRDNPF